MHARRPALPLLLVMESFKVHARGPPLSGASGGSRGGTPGAHQEHDAPLRAGTSDVSQPGARKKGV